ncbi:NifB/NifX family molybdenum-iron cluster-binding protein [Thermotoga sp.]|uniref:NifB/NifX family molybdenum-iron cluster-binding protein n=1 Tax=Thermotoga sp. TaxID=28240 RepID=UPI0025D0CF43|nr:NifB/NifX family molybdenum-iron cluster-binding protein [Thermotoga sp.]MCD6550906.1 NifB/NifX family molybdenum-iron cluster-binding protein [Thermotoga sp.]
MIIAIPVATDEGLNSAVSEHFGRAPYYAFVKVENGKIVSLEVEPNPFPEHAAGELPAYMRKKNVDVLIVRGIGQRALRYLNEYGIQVIRGAQGTVEDAVKRFIQNQLKDTEYKPAEHFHNRPPRRIAIPATAENPDSEMDQRFARAAYIAIFDEATGQFSFYKNTVDEAHGAGPRMAQFLAEKKVDVLITANVGTNAYNALRMAGIEVYLFERGTVREALEAFREGKLERMGGPTHSGH